MARVQLINHPARYGIRGGRAAQFLAPSRDAGANDPRETSLRVSRAIVAPSNICTLMNAPKYTTSPTKPSAQLFVEACEGRMKAAVIWTARPQAARGLTLALSGRPITESLWWLPGGFREWVKPLPASNGTRKSYYSLQENGAPEEIRTPNLLIRREGLSRCVKGWE
jgi:hypothetical protein